MKLSAEIKQYFKKIGIPVRVRTVAVKNPFVQVWITPDKIGINEPLIYSYQFPLAMRQKLLKMIYGADCDFAAGGNAGNVRPHDMSFRENEWRELISSVYHVNITAGALNWEWTGRATDKNDATQKARAWAIQNDCIPTDFKLSEPNLSLLEE